MTPSAAPVFHIRPIDPAEYARETDLVHAAYAAGPYRDELANDEAWAATEQDSAGRDAAGRILVAVAGDTLVGAVTVLRDGRRVLLRPFAKKDVPALFDFFQRLPEESRRFAWDRLDDRHAEGGV